MADADNNEVEINPSPESVGDLTDAQIDEALEGIELDDEGQGAALEFGEVEVDDTDDDDNKDGIDDDADDNPDDDGASDDDDSESVDDDEDADDDSESVDDDDSKEDKDAAIPAAQREAMEAVLNRMEVMEAERDQLNAKLEQAEILRDRNAGKLGSLLQKFEKRDASKGADDSYNEDDDDAGSDDKTPSKAQTAVEEGLAEIRQEKVARSVNNAAQDFYLANTEFFSTLETEAGKEKSDAFQADLIARVTAANKEVGEEILAMSPKMAGKMAAAVIKTCFADMRVDLLRDFKSEASKKADKSRKAIRARKKGAAGTRSRKRPGTTTTKTKSLSKMSDKELDAALAAAAGSFD